MILVTGASGQVGRAVVRSLGPTAPVRVLVRDEQRAAGLGAARLAVGSFEDEPSLARAMDGIATLFLAGRDNPDQVAQHARVLRAAAAAGVTHVVKLSALGATPASPVGLMRSHAATEAELRASHFSWTFLRPHLYMQNLLRFAAAVAGEGRLVAPMGAHRYPLVDTRDVAEAAAAVLRAPSAYAGQAYALTGPRGLAYAEIAELLAGIVGREVEYVAAAPQDFRAGLVAAGIPAWRADDLAGIAAAYSDADEQPSDDAEALLGRPPTAIDRFLADHRDTFLAGASRSHA
ncbi:MAG TPA: NmrA family NAD(P)-binding protein [Gaiellales bacterium]